MLLASCSVYLVASTPILLLFAVDSFALSLPLSTRDLVEVNGTTAIFFLQQHNYHGIHLSRLLQCVLTSSRPAVAVLAGKKVLDS